MSGYQTWERSPIFLALIKKKYACVSSTDTNFLRGEEEEELSHTLCMLVHVFSMCACIETHLPLYLLSMPGVQAVFAAVFICNTSKTCRESTAVILCVKKTKQVLHY